MRPDGTGLDLIPKLWDTMRLLSMNHSISTRPATLSLGAISIEISILLLGVLLLIGSGGSVI